MLIRETFTLFSPVDIDVEVIERNIKNIRLSIHKKTDSAHEAELKYKKQYDLLINIPNNIVKEQLKDLKEHLSALKGILNRRLIAHKLQHLSQANPQAYERQISILEKFDAEVAGLYQTVKQHMINEMHNPPESPSP